MNLLKKVPWKAVLRVAGYAAVGVASVWSAVDTDEKTQEFVKKLAEKSSTLVEKRKS